MGTAKRWNKSYSELSSEFGVNPSTIKYWTKCGYDLNNQEVLLSLASKAKNKIDALKLAANKEEVLANKPKPRPIVLEGSLGLAGSLQRLRQAELELSTAYADALKAGSTDSFTLRQEWLGVCEALRKAEKDSPDVQAANKNAITVDELEETLLKLFLRLRTNLESLPTRVTKEIDQQYAPLLFNNITVEIKSFIEDLYSCSLLEKRE